MKTPLSPNERALRIVLLAGVALAFGFLIAKPPIVMPCGFRNLSGLPCAMCGGTRAAASVLGGDWGRAIYWNAMVLPVLAGMAAGAGICLIELLRGAALFRWNALPMRLGRFFALALFLLAAWWVWHVASALKTPKLELVDLENPIAATVAAWLGIH